MPPDADDFSIFDQVRATASRRVRLRLGLPASLRQAIPIEIALVAPAWLLVCPARRPFSWPAAGFEVLALAVSAAALVFFRRMGSRPLEIGWRILLFSHLLRFLNRVTVAPALPPDTLPSLAGSLSIVGGLGMLWGLRLDGIRRATNIERLKRALRDRRDSHHRFVELVDTVDGVVWEALAEPFQFLFVSRRAGLLLGFSSQLWLQQPNLWLDRIHFEDRRSFLDQIAEATQTLQGYRLEYRMTAADGRTIWVRDLVNVVEDAEGGVKLRGVTVDVTETKLLEQRLRHSAHHDPLTGLPNRVAFTEALELACRKAPAGRTFAVLFLDLDRFKIVNDTLGHFAGDIVLHEAGARIQRAVRSRDVVARLGGDEFAVLAENLRSPDEAVELANRLRQEVNRPVEVNGRFFALSASIGVKVAPAGSATPHDMLRDADTAMYCAKETACGSHRVFQQEMRERLEADLDRAGRNLLAARNNSATTSGAA